jgi:hypothetical protein
MNRSPNKWEDDPPEIAQDGSKHVTGRTAGKYTAFNDRAGYGRTREHENDVLEQEHLHAMTIRHFHRESIIVDDSTHIQMIAKRESKDVLQISNSPPSSDRGAHSPRESMKERYPLDGVDDYAQPASSN